MELIGPESQPILDEMNLVKEMLPLSGARILELGCGGAEKTRALAKIDGVSAVVGVEIDTVQHKKNIENLDEPKVEFKSYGAQAIEEDDASVDIVMMFKSLHHVPIDEMQKAMQEINRVLKPGGLAYISEPVFNGDFNEILRLFHDEQIVRERAFFAIQDAVKSSLLHSEKQVFFKSMIKLSSFEQFEVGILQATHTDHALSESLYQEVKEKFLAHESDQGFVFEFPNRVDLLKKI